jgi:hypothetical protein
VKDHSVEMRRHAVNAIVTKAASKPLPLATSTAGSVEPSTARAITATKLAGIVPVRQPATTSLPLGTTTKRSSGGAGTASCRPCATANKPARTWVASL